MSPGSLRVFFFFLGIASGLVGGIGAIWALSGELLPGLAIVALGAIGILGSQAKLRALRKGLPSGDRRP